LENLSTDNNVLIFGHRLSKLRKNIIYAAGVQKVKLASFNNLKE
tara:strand:+ start:174 stop:305 length:132 start_codon:yes stop_codon:yes gene_type:complete